MRSYEKALKSGIQLKEESVNLLKDPLTKNGALDLKRTARDGMNIVGTGPRHRQTACQKTSSVEFFWRRDWLEVGNAQAAFRDCGRSHP